MAFSYPSTDWNHPFSFFSSTYSVRDEEGIVQRTISGSIGAFLNMWTTIIGVIFSYTGMDILAATAAESKALSDAESMKMAVRKLNMRIIILYVLAILTASFVVPRNHPFINGGGTSAGSHSLYIIAAVEAGLPQLAHFFNAMFVFSTFSCAINTLYVASRILHTLALLGYTGPEWITKRLRSTRTGVPVRAVLASSTLLLVAYIGRTGNPGVVSIRHSKIAICNTLLIIGTESKRTVRKLHCVLPDCLHDHLRNVSLLLQNVC
jgi:amino acid transporter